MRSFRTIVFRDLMNLVQAPTFWFYVTAFPLALTGLIGLLTQGQFNGPVGAWDVAAVNVLLYSAVNLAMLGTNSFLEQALKASNLRVLYAPVDETAVVLSKTVATTVFGLLGFVFDIGLLDLCGVHLGPLGGLGLLAVLGVVSFASAGLGVFLVCLVKDEPTANQILSLGVNLAALTGGVFFSLDGFGPGAAWVSALSPLRPLREVVFSSIWSGGAPGFGLVLLVTLAVGLGLVAAGRLVFRSKDFV